MKVADVAIKSNKKKADFKWREWAEHAERTQELYRRASTSQKHAEIELGNGKSPVLLVPFSDQHIGGRGVTYSIFRKMTEEILATPNLYVAIMGDLAEFAIKLRSVAEICAQIFGPDKQMQFVEDWFEEIKPKVAFCTWGNHEDERTEKQAGFSVMKHLMGKEVVYFDGIGHANIRVGKQVYSWAVTHKFRGSSFQNPCHAGMRYMRFQGVDREIAWMGDIHQPAYIHYFDGPRARLSGVAGTLNVNSLYAGRYFSIFTQPDFPCVLMDNKEHEFTALPNLARWRKLTGK